jgi:hypothetical protein
MEIITARDSEESQPEPPVDDEIGKKSANENRENPA